MEWECTLVSETVGGPDGSPTKTLWVEYVSYSEATSPSGPKTTHFLTSLRSRGLTQSQVVGGVETVLLGTVWVE